MRIVRATTTMHVTEYRMLKENELLPDDDPLVVAHPEWFTDDLEPLFNRTGDPVIGKRRTTATQQPVEAR